MGLKTTLDNLDSLDESLHEHYKLDEKTKKYLLDLEDVEQLPRVVALKTEAGQHRIKAKEAGEKLKAFTALGDLDDVQSKLDRIPELEAAAEGKLDETKLAPIIEARVKKAVAPLERDAAKLRDELATANSTLEVFKGEKKARTISDHVRNAIAKSTGFIASAADDAVVFAERMLELTEDGSVVTRDSVGVTPGVDAVVWLNEMQAKKPHWWGPTAGGGAGGSRNSSNGTANPFSAEHWNMTQQGVLIKENRQRAEQLAKSAGTTIGGGKPAKKS